MMNLSAYPDYAVPVEGYLGRVFPTSADELNPFKKDKKRILLSKIFQYLTGKAQVDIAQYNDAAINRFSHTIQVAFYATEIAQELGLNIDLVEAMALLHDIGHPAFGHIGEDILGDITEHHQQSRFNHNVFGAVYVGSIAKRNVKNNPFGFNLSKETMHAMFKNMEIRERFKSLFINPDTNGILHRTGEDQLVDTADSDMYTLMDLSQAIRMKLPGCSIEELSQFQLIATAQEYAEKNNLELHEALYEILKQDLIENSRPKLEARNSFKELQAKDITVICHSDAVQKDLKAINKYLDEKWYNNKKKDKRRDDAAATLQMIFDKLLKKPTEKTDAIRDRLNQMVEEENYWLPLLLKEGQKPEDLNTEVWAPAIQIARLTDRKLLELANVLELNVPLKPITTILPELKE